jgi:iron complex outermembrane recepter protein
MRLKATLLSSLALGTLVSATHAQIAAPPPAPTADAAPAPEDVIIYGRGQARQVQEVSGKKLDLEAPGTSPLKVLQLLPSVNFQSADPFGAYEWSTRITIRGFNQNRLGFTLDDLPLGDMSYGNHNGLHISRAIISENVGRTVLAQGTGAIGTASTSNLGGTLQFYTRDPSDAFGVRASAGYGSNNSLRLFARGDSGDLGTGTKLFVSGVYQKADKWKGSGQQRATQVNARITQDIGEIKATGFVNYSNRAENDYQDLSLEQIARLGYDWDNFAPDWATAVRVAQIAGNRRDTGTGPTAGVGTVYPSPITSVDDAYYDASGLRKDWLYGARIDAPVAENIGVKLVGYGHNNKGQGLWWTPYVRSPGSVPIAVRTTEYDINRKGALADVTADFEALKLEAGVWYEENKFNQARRFYALDNTLAASSRDSLKFQTNPFATQWEYKFKTTTRQFHVGASYTFDPVTLSVGAKSVRVSNRVVPVGGFGVIAFPADAIVSKDNFLPQAGFTVKVSPENEIFGGYSENLAAFVAAATSGPFATTAAGFSGIRTTLKPERSRTLELGWRFNYDRVSGVVSVYTVKFANRLLGVSTGPGIIGSPVALQNVGDVRSQGLETAITLRPVEAVSLTASYSYNDNKYLNDVLNGAGVLVAAIKDKTVVDSPKHLLKAEASYDNGSFFAKADVNHLSRRFFTYTNDQSVPGQTLVNATLGYRFGEQLGLPGTFTLQGNVTNLFDDQYVSTIGSNGFGNSGDNQTLLAGAPRQFFVSLRADF